ncbi:MAG: four helix bundle protein, partial [Bacteroidota bacterium]
MRENIIATKTYDFAINVVMLSKSLVSKNEYVISKQILKSGTSIGANVE